MNFSWYNYFFILHFDFVPKLLIIYFIFISSTNLIFFFTSLQSFCFPFFFGWIKFYDFEYENFCVRSFVSY